MGSIGQAQMWHETIEMLIRIRAADDALEVTERDKARAQARVF